MKYAATYQKCLSYLVGAGRMGRDVQEAVRSASGQAIVTYDADCPLTADTIAQRYAAERGWTLLAVVPLPW